MQYYTIKPSASIADYVRFFWVLEGEGSSSNPFFHRALPDYCPELIFYCNGHFTFDRNRSTPEKTFSSGIYGQSQHYYKFKAELKFRIFGAYLYPYTIPHLLSLPANEVSNEALDLITLLGKEGEILEERMLSAADDHQRAQILTLFFERKLKKAKHVDTVSALIKKITDSGEMAPVTTLASQSFLSRRQFERRFKIQAGFSPNEFLRLVRFTAILKSSPVIDQSLGELALTCGYYDQSHFIHDFTLYSGYSPKEFFKQKLDAATYRAASEFKM
jgi:AraC-like DNA-binding protein